MFVLSYRIVSRLKNFKMKFDTCKRRVSVTCFRFCLFVCLFLYWFVFFHSSRNTSSFIVGVLA